MSSAFLPGLLVGLFGGGLIGAMSIVVVAAGSARGMRVRPDNRTSVQEAEGLRPEVGIRGSAAPRAR